VGLFETIPHNGLAFIFVGLGGHVGAASAMVAADIARKSGAIAIGMATWPFRFEALIRDKPAMMQIGRLHGMVSALYILPNDKLLAMSGPGAVIAEALDAGSDEFADLAHDLSNAAAMLKNHFDPESGRLAANIAGAFARERDYIEYHP